MNNPFDFLADFERWFYYEKCIHFDKLRPDVAEQDTRACCGDWERAHPVVNGRHSGGWRLKSDVFNRLLNGNN